MKTTHKHGGAWRVAAIATALMIAAATLQLAGCSGEAKEKDPVVSVEAAVAQPKTLHTKVQTEAIVFPLHQSALVPKISAPVKKFYVNRGSHVRAGQLLAVLENRDLTAGAEQSKGEYAQAEAAYTTATTAGVPEEVRKAELDDEAARQALETEQKLYDSRKQLFEQGALPRKDFDQAAVALTQARNTYDITHKHLQALLAVGKQAELKSAAGQLTAAQGKYRAASAQLSYSEIRSPISGVVTDRPLYPGEMAAAGTPLLTVMDLSRVIAKAHIPQDQAALLRKGTDATITVPGADEPVNGKVTVVSPALDPNSTTVEIWVEAANPKEIVKPGSTVHVSILAQTVPNALTIPASALLTEPDGTTSVMVVGDDSRAHQTDVKPGIREGDELQILAGLKPGERVVTTGAYGLPDKTKVKIGPAEQGTKDKESKDSNDAAKDGAGKAADDEK